MCGSAQIAWRHGIDRSLAKLLGYIVSEGLLGSL